MARKLYFEKAELRRFMIEYVEELEKQGLSKAEIDDRIGKYYTNHIIKKYSKEEQDRMWNELYNLIMNVPGGYWQVVENMDYMPEFEYWRFKGQKSAFGLKKNRNIYK
jgi:hypothetical protein